MPANGEMLLAGMDALSVGSPAATDEICRSLRLPNTRRAGSARALIGSSCARSLETSCDCPSAVLTGLLSPLTADSIGCKSDRGQELSQANTARSVAHKAAHVLL